MPGMGPGAGTVAVERAELVVQVSCCPEQAGNPGGRAEDLYRRAEQAKQHSRALMAQLLRLSYEIERASAPVTLKEMLEHSPYARLLARLQTMPVIEQAKGIIIARAHCEEAEAFDILRRASQRSNVPVRELAVHIVANTRRVAACSAEPGQRQHHVLAPGPSATAPPGAKDLRGQTPGTSMRLGRRSPGGGQPMGTPVRTPLVSSRCTESRSDRRLA